MKTLRAAILALGVFAQSAVSQNITPALDKYMQSRADLGQFSGSILVARNGKILLEKGYGYASFELGVPNTVDTRFRAASITKQFTAMAILQLRDAGRLRLDDSLCRFIDDCPDAWKPVTLLQIIHHESGIPDYEEALGLGTERYAAFFDSAASTQRIIKDARTKPLDFPPGSKFNYSNTGYILLAAVIEKVSGESYASYIEAHLLEPAGMTHSFISNSTSFVRGAAYGYTGREDTPLDSLVAGMPFLKGSAKLVANTDMSGSHGDGALITTVGDLMKWNQALAGTKIISQKSIPEFFKPSFPAEDTVKEEGYAFGWIISTQFDQPYDYHTGLLPGFASRIERYPESGLFIIAMANYDAVRLSRITRDLAAAAMGKPYDVPRSHRIVQIDSASMKKLVGQYRLAAGSVANVSIGPKYVLLEVPGRFTAGLLPESATTFYAPFFEGTVKFTEDANGNVTALTMHYNGTDRVATRVAAAPH
jgi:CubicO group peptidase (beta-lactamase class C family)